MTDTVKTWGYSKDGAKLFDLKKGGKLPSGYYDTPANIPAEKPKANVKGKVKS